MRTLFLLLISLFFSPVVVLSQQFQRTLNPSRLSPGVDIDPTSDGKIGVLSTVAGPSLFSGVLLNLTTLSLQEGIVQSYDYRLTNALAADGQAIWWPSENAWLLGMSVLDNARNKALLKIQPDGAISWAKSFGELDDIQSVNIGRIGVALSSDNKAIIAGAAGNFALNDDRNDLFVAKINPNGSTVWEKQVRFSLDKNADAALGSLLTLPDGNLLISGTVNQNFSESDNLFLLKMDASGNLLWAKQYGTNGAGFGAKEKGLHLCLLPNDHIVMSGWVDENFAFNQDGLLMETDADGGVVRALSFDIQNADFNLQINRVIATDDQTLVFSIGAWENATPTDALELNVMASVRLDGTVLWQHNYFDEILVGFGTAGDALIARSPSGGYLMLANDSQNFESLRPVLIGTDETGRTGCEKSVALRVNTNRVFTAQNLNPVVVAVSTNQNVGANRTIFNGYEFNLPKLDIGPDTTLCAPGQLTINALVPGAETYTWNTGANAPTLNVTTSGVYSVIARSNQACFVLSDSIRVEVEQAAQVSIVADSSTFCEDGLITLTASSSSSDAVIMWSNGTKNDNIAVEAAGVYTVSAENDCGILADTIVVSLPECPGDCTFYVPNAFTPNNDGVNDTYGPFGGDCVTLSDYIFRIYDRWGSLVFESRSPDVQWDGTLAGKPSPTEVFVWQFEYKTKRQGTVRRSGDVTLLR